MSLLEKTKKFAADHILDCIAELDELSKTGTLPEGKVRELHKIYREETGDVTVSRHEVQNLIGRVAMEELVKARRTKTVRIAGDEEIVDIIRQLFKWHEHRKGELMRLAQAAKAGVVLQIDENDEAGTIPLTAEGARFLRSGILIATADNFLGKLPITIEDNQYDEEIEEEDCD